MRDALVGAGVGASRGPRLCTALLGTIAIAFLVSNLHFSTRLALGSGAGGKGKVRASAVGLTASGAASPQRIFNYLANALRVAPPSEAAVAARRKARADPAAEALGRALDGTKRDLCGQRFPQGLALTEEQEDFVRSQRYFFVLTLRNNEDLLHHTLYELLHLIRRLGPANVFVSIFENNSKDKTPQFLAFFTSMLKIAGVEHNLVSSWTIKEAAAEAASGGGGGGGAEKAGGGDGNGSSSSLPPISDLSSLESKWTGNRIEFLAKVRNLAVRPLFAQSRRYDKMIFMNDAYVCAEDILRLVLHRDAQVSCGLDFDTTNAYGVGFYDTWVDRDVHGEEFKKREPFVQRGPDAERLRKGLPFPVFCCWNGVLVADAQPLYDGVRFRRSKPGECAASECSLFCKDYWLAGVTRFAIDPHVRLAYDLPTYHALHKVGWLEEGPFALPEGGAGRRPERWPEGGEGASVPVGLRVGTNRSQVSWPEDIPWPPHGPNRVFCCGLEGSGRDADQGCIREELKLPRRPAIDIGRIPG